MKGIILCSVLLMVCFFLEAQAECDFENRKLSVGVHTINCIKYTCNKDGSISALGCPAYACKEQIGYNEPDVNKPYPECCGGPICKETK